jgi:hypothetical protein
MIRATTIVRKLAVQRKNPELALDIVELYQSLAKALFDPYRPELHYMRGPGPKWHAKHDRPHVAKAAAVPALMPARAAGARLPALIRCRNAS